MPPLSLGLGLGLSRASRPPPLVLDFRSAAASFGVTAPAGCGYTRAACVSTVQTGTSTLVDLSVFSATANLIVRGRALDAWEYGLQLEEARTNSVPYSSDYTTGGGLRWTLAGTVTKTTGQTGPDGAASATRVQAATAGDYQYFRASGLGASAQTAASSWVSPRTPPGDTAISATGGGGVAALASAGWRRLASVGPATGSGVCDLYTVFGGDIPAVIAAGARDWHLYGSQIEVGGFPTSYIPTAGATATRNANFLPVLGATWASRILAGRVGLELWLRPMGARSEYSGTRYLWWIDANNHVAFNASTGVLTVMIAGASNTTSAITWSRYADVKVYVELGGSLATYVAVLIDGVRTVPSITGSALGSLAAGDLYLRSSSTTGSTCAWLYMQTFWSPGTRPSWAW